MIVMNMMETLKRWRVEWVNFASVLMAGFGFLTDGYNLFCVSYVTRLLGRLDYSNPGGADTGRLPDNIEATINSIAFFGMLVGQLVFGSFGIKRRRKSSCVTTVVIIMTSAIMSSLSFGRTQKAVIASLVFFRFWLGFGIGGDLPITTSIISESFNQRNRGGFMAATFAMQGLGILSAATVTLVVCAIFQAIYGASVPENGKIGSTPSQADFAWRIILGLGAVPAALTVYLRAQMKDLLRRPNLLCLHSSNSSEDLRKVLKTKFGIEAGNVKVQKSEAIALFSRKFLYKYGMKLFACAGTRFLLAFVFYSQILYMKDIFDAAGWLPDPREMNGFMELKYISRAQAIMTAVAIIPGYWLTAATIDCIGRYIIQVQGFLFMTVMSIVLVATFDWFMENKHSGYFLVCFGLELFFINFGPNVTTFIFPAEIFPGPYRTQCHAITSAAGKIGGILGVFLFVLFMKDKTDGGRVASGFKPTLGIIAAANGLGLIISLFFPETKGVPLEGETERVGDASSMSSDSEKLTLAKSAKLAHAKSMSHIHAIIANVSFSDSLEVSKSSPMTPEAMEKVGRDVTEVFPTMQFLRSGPASPLPPLPSSLGATLPTLAKDGANAAM